MLTPNVFETRTNIQLIIYNILVYRGHNNVFVPILKVWLKNAMIEPYFYHTVSIHLTNIFSKYSMVHNLEDCQSL